MLEFAIAAGRSSQLLHATLAHRAIRPCRGGRGESLLHSIFEAAAVRLFNRAIKTVCVF